MNYYRVTKYNPALRNEKGWYMHDEWTDFSCVGTEINGKICTLEEYESTENLYIQAILQFLSCLNLDSLECNSVEKSSKVFRRCHLPNAWKDIHKRVKSGTIILKSDLPILLKLILRNYLWCKLIHDDSMFVRFGWDYYMYVGTATACSHAVKLIEDSGLFVETFISPYLESDDE